MNEPTIAIVGRPNVGKSSLFNALVGRRISIVEPTPGVTRDRISAEIHLGDRPCQLVDTGGIGMVDEARLDVDVERQIQFALQEADFILFLVDGQEGITPLDQKVADILRRLGKPLVLGVNKIDHPRFETQAYEFYSLGLGDPIALSVEQGMGLTTISDALAELLPDDQSVIEGNEHLTPEQQALMKVAFVGRRNVGKSTLLNAFAGQERVIVSDIPGTTRDAVDVEVDYRGQRFIAIDTAGMLRASRIRNSIEFYSQARTESAIRRADVVLFIIDATTEISIVDKKIGAEIIEAKKPCVVVLNKWDLAPPGMMTSDFQNYLAERLPGLHFAPALFMSAKKKKNLEGAIDLAFQLYSQAEIRIGTGELNRALERAFAKRHPGGHSGHKARLFYGTQVDVRPPTFVLFVNEIEFFGDDYARYIENELRATFDFAEIPLRVLFKPRVSIFHD